MGEAVNDDGLRDPDAASRGMPRKVPERIPLWKLEEMVGNPPPVTTPRREEPSTPPPRRRRRFFSRAMTVFGAVGLVLALFMLAPDITAGVLGVPEQKLSQPHTTRGGALDLQQAPADRQPANRPPQGVGEQPHPLGRPPALAVTNGSYAFANLRGDGKPVAYDPCREIHYVTRPDNQPGAGPQLIQEAVAAISRATGLVFVDDGATTETPTSDFRGYQKDRYGQRWAPVLIAWQTEGEEPRFKNPAEGDTVMGLGGSESASIGDSGMSYVTGQVTLNAAAFARVIRESGTASARAIVEHELGHVVGLTHVDDASQLMNPSVTPGVVAFGAGDLTGLAALGQGRCQPGL